MEGWLPGAALAALVVVASTFWWVRRTRRRSKLRRVAGGLGLEPAGNDDAADAEALLSGSLFAAARGEAKNRLKGRLLGMETVVFESGRPGTRGDPFAFFRVEGLELPPFELRPRGEGDGRSPALPEARRFNEIYTLTGSATSGVRDLFRGPVLRFFERAENQSWALVSDGAWLGVGVWPLGERTRPLEAKHLAAFVEDAKLVLAVLTGRTTSRPPAGAGHGKDGVV